MNDGEHTMLELIRVPATLRQIIIENKLAKNDINVLLLIIERTLTNVYPPTSSAALSVRYIAEQNQCSDKGAENSVNKLKRLNLITQNVPSKMAPGELSLNPDVFTAANTAGNVPETDRNSPLRESAMVKERHRVQDEIQMIRELMFDAVNSGRKTRETKLPDPFLAALYLDYFGSPSKVADYLDSLHADLKKRKRRVEGYGFYHHKITGLRDSAVYGTYLDSIPVTEPLSSEELTAIRGMFQKKGRKGSVAALVV